MLMLLMCWASQSSAQPTRTWVDGDVPLQKHIESIIEHKGHASYTYKAQGSLGIPQLTITRSIDYNESERKPRVGLSLAGSACAYLDAELGAVGAWGPECKITKWLKKPQGKLEVMTESLAKQIEYYKEGDIYRDGDYFYTPKSMPVGFGHDSARYILENGKGKKAEVIFKLAIEKRVDCTKVDCDF
jgi:hypothetical protein